MRSLDHHEIVVLFLSLAALLGSARVLGEIARKLNQPVILGEIMAGVLLGPTVLGSLAPGWGTLLFPSEGRLALVLNGLTTLSVVMFLLVAGMEVDLSTIWRQGKSAIYVALSGIVVPSVLGLTLGWSFPTALGFEAGTDPTIFALFMAVALSISALPVIARTLMDLNLYRSDLGMIVIAAAIFDDLTGWIIFAIVLGMMGASQSPGLEPFEVASMVLGFAAVMLTLGRWFLNKALVWIQAHTSWPGGVLSFSLCAALLAAAITEWIGVHAIFGSFLVGVALGESKHLREQTRTVLHDFIAFIFAPLFFASIGLKVNFIAHFDGLLVLTVFLIACLGKVVGCGLGARFAGMATREAWAVGFAMNARGAMEIILGLLALQHGLIRERLFVALVIMALATSLLSGPCMQKLLRLTKRRRIIDFLEPKAFIPRLSALDSFGAIKELASALAGATGLEPIKIEEAVLARERIQSTGVGDGIAVPHARIEGLTLPMVAMGLSAQGIDFDAPDGKPARTIFLILSGLHDDGAQLELLADIARTFRNASTRETALSLSHHRELRALLKSSGG